MRTACAILAAAMVAGLAGAAEISTESTIEAVTVYRGQAMVTRLVELPKATGELELIVGDLPEHVVPDSLSAGGDGVKIRSVRFRQKAVSEIPRKEVAELDEKIKEFKYVQLEISQAAVVAKQREAYLNKLENFTAGKTAAAADKASLDPKALIELSEYLFNQREHLAKRNVELQKQADTVREELSLLQRKRSQLAAGTQKIVREAVLFLSRPAGTKGPVRLHYLVNNATWSPAYNVRMDNGAKKISLEYVGHIRQTTGEDWKGVQLSLSTASPMLNATIPVLTPMWVALRPNGGVSMGQLNPSGQPEPGKSPQGYVANGPNVFADFHQRQKIAQDNWNARRDGKQQNLLMNRNAGWYQNNEMIAGVKELKRWQYEAEAMREGLAVTYKIESAQSIASRSDQQIVQIRQANLPATSYYRATPLLASYVFRGAELENTMDIPLLAGGYSAYLSGEFVGSGNLPMVAMGQKVEVGFGTDSQLQVRRELADKSDTVSLGSRVKSFDYKLTVESFKNKPVSIQLLDRMPATKSSDMEIKLAKTSQDLSADAEYVARDKGEGILRWDLSVPAGASGSKALAVTYTFEMKYANDRSANAQPAALEGLMEQDLRKRMK